MIDRVPVITRDALASILVFALALAACGEQPAPLDARNHLGFWDAVRTLDLGVAEELATTVDERLFLEGLGVLLSGQSAQALESFCALAKTTGDEAVRRHAVTLASGLFRQAAVFGGKRDVDAFLDCIGIPMLLATRETEGDGTRTPAERNTEEGLRHLSEALGALMRDSLPADVLSFPDGPNAVALKRAKNGLPVVPVTVNGKTFDFLLDTGFSYSAVSASVARACGVSAWIKGRIPIEGSTGGTVSGQFGIVKQLSIGELGIENHTVLIIDDGDLTIADMALDGVLGWPVFHGLAVEIDPVLARVTFGRSNGPDGGLRNLYWIGEPIVRLAARDGSPLLFQLDTGLDVTFLSAGLLTRLGLEDIEGRRDTRSGLGGSLDVDALLVPELRLHAGDTQLDFTQLSAYERMGKQDFVRYDGCLGADVTHAGRVLVDFPAGRFEITVPDED